MIPHFRLGFVGSRVNFFQHLHIEVIDELLVRLSVRARIFFGHMLGVGVVRRDNSAAAFEFGFLGGSMGSVVGERFGGAGIGIIDDALHFGFLLRLAARLPFLFIAARSLAERAFDAEIAALVAQAEGAEILRRMPLAAPRLSQPS